MEAQERELLATLDSLIAEETWAPGGELDGGGGGGAGVLRSASALFAVIKTSLLRCSKYITRGPALLQLMNTFQVSVFVVPFGAVQEAYRPGPSFSTHFKSQGRHADTQCGDRVTMQKVVQSYAARLTARLPKTAIGATSGTPQLGAVTLAKSSTPF